MKKILIGIVVIAVVVASALAISPVIFHKMNAAVSGDALTLLKEGNARFVAAKMKYPNQGAERRKETARHGQKPYAIVLACADSRIPVETLFDAGIGDIFVVRNAGNVAQDDIVAGSIEYAAKHLHSHLLVILGHTECGAVQAALSEVPAAGNIRAIQKMIEPAAAEVRKNAPALRGPELLSAVITSNTLKSEADLLAKSDIIRNMSDKGTLKIVTAVYDIETGAIRWDE